VMTKLFLAMFLDAVTGISGVDAGADYDGSWALTIKTARGTCDPAYSFEVDIRDAKRVSIPGRPFSLESGAISTSIHSQSIAPASCASSCRRLMIWSRRQWRSSGRRGRGRTCPGRRDDGCESVCPLGPVVLSTTRPPTSRLIQSD
jgi:hypothetical protein